jgi:hypothetical protein
LQPKEICHLYFTTFLFEADELSSKIYLDFSGLESLTDYGVYQFCEMIKKNKKIGDQIKFSEIKLSACRYVSVWALQYLSLASGITLFDLYSAEFMLGQKLIGCERISQSMSASLEHPKHEHRSNLISLAFTGSFVKNCKI